MGGEEGEDGVGFGGAVEAESTGESEGGFAGEAAVGDEVGDCEGVRLRNGGERVPS